MHPMHAHTCASSHVCMACTLQAAWRELVGERRGSGLQQRTYDERAAKLAGDHRPVAQTLLGHLWNDGEGCARDPRIARSW